MKRIVSLLNEIFSLHSLQLWSLIWCRRLLVVVLLLLSLCHVIQMSRAFIGDAHDADVAIIAYNITDCFAMETKEVVEIVNTKLV